MPVLLLIVGVSLVGVAAIFFLVYAWYLADIGVKSLIIGGVTLATMIGASVLRRFSLRATAEAIAAIGIILLGLDGWAVRANDLFGAGAMDPAVYAGVAALTLGVICRLWAVISKLRGPDLAATLALPAGVGLLAAGLVPLEPTGAIAVGFLGTAVGGLAHALPAPLSAARSGADSVLERTALAVIGVAALVGGTIMLVVGLESMLVQLAVAGAVIILGIAYALVLRPRGAGEPLPIAVVLGATASAIAAATAASLGWQMVAHSDLPVYAALVGPVLAVVVAVALDLVAATGTADPRRADRRRRCRWGEHSCAGPRHDPPCPSYRSARDGRSGIRLSSRRPASPPTPPPLCSRRSPPWSSPRCSSSLRRSTGRSCATCDPRVAAVIAILGGRGHRHPDPRRRAWAQQSSAIALIALARGAGRGGWGATAAIGALTAFLGAASPCRGCGRSACWWPSRCRSSPAPSCDRRRSGPCCSPWLRSGSPPSRR